MLGFLQTDQADDKTQHEVNHYFLFFISCTFHTINGKKNKLITLNGISLEKK